MGRRKPKKLDARAGLFFDFLSNFEKKLTDKPLGMLHVPKSLKKDLPGLFQLFQTLTAASILEDDAIIPVEEWNPFSQRMFFRGKNYFSQVNLMGDFEFTAIAIDRFIEATHEAVHILLMEPFFTGRSSFSGLESFMKTSFSFEAFCFWYADIRVTRRLRVRFPDGEWVRSKSAASQKLFHPYRAFLALGIKNEREILKLYLGAFNGKKINGKKSEKSLYVSNLNSRLLKLYSFHANTNAILYDLLHKVGIFDSFQKRFCSDQRLPTIFSGSKIQDLKPLDDIDGYCLGLADRGFTILNEMSTSKIKRIEMRRHIQMRAYYAFTLQYVLQENLFFSLTGKKYTKDKFLSATALYLDHLESCIQMLAEGATLNKILLKCKQADRFYTKNLQKPFTRLELWMSQRVGIYPKFDTEGNCLGRVDKNHRFSRKDIGAINFLLLKQIASKSVGQKPVSPVLLAKIAKMIQLCPTGISYPAKDQLQWRKLYQELIQEPGVLKLWSIPLSSFDPEKNRFRELLFIYE